ncbi:MAG TPA: cytochrome b/b6 domain-containing protein [Acidobacteriaceae bacterium]
MNTVATPAETPTSETAGVRHAAVVRVTHWLTFVSCTALLVTGLLIVISHPRFYWGETGSNLTKPLFALPIPASRDLVPTGYHYVMPDENGWSRYLHFEMAWVLVITGAVYLIYGVWSGHFRRHLLPGRGGWSLKALWSVAAKYLRGARYADAEDGSYNALQRVAYLAVIFVLVPMLIWTGLALSPAFDSAAPAAVNLLGGRQSARTLHFLLTWVLVLFVAVHVTMVAISGFWKRMRGMITGR